jgi:hypothetical protein
VPAMERRRSGSWTPGRPQVGPYSSPWGSATTRNVSVTGADGVPLDTSALVVHATVTDTTGSTDVIADLAGWYG